MSNAPQSTLDTQSQSMLSTKLGARRVSATLDCPGTITEENDSVIVTRRFSSGKLVVHKTRILYRDTELAQIPESATEVAIDTSGGRLSITADGLTVYNEDVFFK